MKIYGGGSIWQTSMLAFHFFLESPLNFMIPASELFPLLIFSPLFFFVAFALS